MPTSLGPAEILVILVVALIVLGPKRLPEAGRQVGKAIAEVRRWTTEVKSEIQGVIDVEPPKYSTVVEPVVVSGTATSVAAADDSSVSDVVQPVTVSVDEPAFAVPTESAAADPEPVKPEPTAQVQAEPELELEPQSAQAAVSPAVEAQADEAQTTEPEPRIGEPLAAAVTSDAAAGGAPVEIPESPSGDPARL
jgi:sec-independent protein translocase protein TatA